MVTKLTICAVLFLGADAKPATDATPAAAAEAPAKIKVKLVAIEKEIIELTNAERARYGLPALEMDPELQESAREHATWMTTNQSMRHTGKPVAENIAMGQQSSEEVVRCWMNSSGHRANILNGGHRRIGAAAYRTVHGTIFWCQQFLQ